MTYNSEPIQKFIERYNNAVKSKSNAMRIDIDLASEINSSITQLLNELKYKDSEITDLQQKLIEVLSQNQKNEKTSQDSDSFDGGSF